VHQQHATNQPNTPPHTTRAMLFFLPREHPWVARYISPLWSEARRDAAVKLCCTKGAQLNLGGRVRVAREGFNGTLSGLPESVQAFAAALREFDPHFHQCDFKIIPDLPVDKAFKELTIYPVQELVHYGIDANTSTTLPPEAHLDPAACVSCRVVCLSLCLCVSLSVCLCVCVHARALVCVCVCVRLRVFQGPRARGMMALNCCVWVAWPGGWLAGLAVGTVFCRYHQKMAEKDTVIIDVRNACVK
jgi:hypothetical protein